MFGTFVLDHDPPQLADLPGGIVIWLQAAGGFAALALVLWLLLGLPRLGARDRAAVPGWMRSLFVLLTLATFLLYAVAGIGLAAGLGQADPEAVALGKTPTGARVITLALTLAGACALLAISLPFLQNIGAMRARRIYALAKLSFKEAVRRRILYAFSALLLVFLFASWFIPSAPKDQVRTYVGVVFYAMSLLLLFTAALMSAFSIPADIKQQTVHTIVTKPVERFEIVAGRFLGFLALMTLVLIVMTAVSLLYVVRGVHPEAAADSLKAREPLYGELRFENTDNDRQATNVGREWDYRSYITRNSPTAPQTARWDYEAVPAVVGTRDRVRCEYTFDIYRTTKGTEGRAITVTFRFYTSAYQAGNEEAFRRERDTATPERLDKMAEELGYFEVQSAPVVDYNTLAFTVPGGLFRGARATEAAAAGGQKRFPLQVRVVPDDGTQYVGMAKYDFYVRLDNPEGPEQLYFAWNFFKGGFGLWLQIALVIAVAVVLSTYLNGVISLLVTLLLLFGGANRDFIESVALGKNVGGGPAEAMSRMIKRELTGPRMDESTSAGDKIVSVSDAAFRLVMRGVLFAIPDVKRLDTTNYVAEGFNIPPGQMLMDFLLLCAYLYPLSLLAFYLLRWREVASTN